jgi:hypothetical protein
MEDFKSNTKMQCFKEGGSVKYESRKQHKEEVSADIAQDKKVVKKAFKIHDTQSHEGKKTDLSKLKKGGRAKKELGTARKFIKPADAPSGAKGGPNKYKTGGSVTNVYEAKKDSGDKDNIKKVKDIKAAKLCGGKSVRKMAAGGALEGQGIISDTERAALQGVLPGGQGMGSANDMERRRMMERAKNATKYLGPAQQSEFVNQGGMATAPSAPVNQPTRPFKKGGKAKKMNTGGTCS